MKEKKNACRTLVRKPEKNRPTERLKRRRVDDVEMNLTETGWSIIDWTDLAQYRDKWSVLVNVVINLWVL
jgi:hypothetical protein